MEGRGIGPASDVHEGGASDPLQPTTNREVGTSNTTNGMGEVHVRDHAGVLYRQGDGQTGQTGQILEDGRCPGTSAHPLARVEACHCATSGSRPGMQRKVCPSFGCLFSTPLLPFFFFFFSSILSEPCFFSPPACKNLAGLC